MDNRLSIARPDLMKEWSDKNKPLMPSDVTFGSHKKVWWRCNKGHEWQASVKSRAGANNSGCPYCSGNKILPGFNDLASQYPEIAAEWSEKNLPLTPEQVTSFSNRRVWWKGKCGHEWYALISSRSGGHGCPYCNDKKLLKGFNDLATLHPTLASEWSQKNYPITPDSIPEKKAGFYWWKCKVCGGEYQAWLTSRLAGSKCPYCSGREVLAGINDLATTDVMIAAEWDYERNGELTPKDVVRTSKKSYWWKSSCGHSWKAKVYERTIENKTCTMCEEEFITALPELLVFLYAGRMGMKVVFCTEEIIQLELEMYIPEMGLVIERAATSEGQRKLQEVKKHLCRKLGISYRLVEQTCLEEEIVTAVRKVFGKEHMHITGDVEEDIRILRDFFFKKRNESR